MGYVTNRNSLTSRESFGISLASYTNPDQMGGVSVRASFTAKGMCTISPWLDDKYKYCLGMLNLGNNFIGKLEIVSALNSLNLAYCQYHYYYINCAEKYNPKVYLSAVLTYAEFWNSDTNSGLSADQKSGSFYVAL